MRLHEMLPQECQRARTENWPLFLPVGTIEYHGEHLPLGVDGIAVIKALDRIEEKHKCIVAPALWYGVSSYAVAGPEKGTIDVNADHFEKHVYDVLGGFFENGFRNIFIVIHHQFEEGSYMPTTLACKKAAMMLTMETLERERGRAWWGDSRMANYYEDMDTSSNPFNWVRVIPLMSPDIQHQMGYDHAGKLETSLMLAALPECVVMDRLAGDGLWFTKEANEASAAHGEETFEMIVDYLIRAVWPQK